jgi:tRNA(fMet)-specific endonuclease VapC
MALRYILDTNICIYISKNNPISVLHKFQQLAVGEAGISIITYGELLFGAKKSHNQKKSLAILEQLISLIPPLPMPIEGGKHYGEICSKLEKIGKPIGNNDLWIAAHVLALDLTLVTNNVKEFSRISDLHIENWVTELD